MKIIDNHSIKKIIFFFFFLHSSFSFACRCNGDITPKKAYEGVDVVLLGKVTSIFGNPFQKGGEKVKIIVFKSWKASVSEVITVFSSTSCAFNFQMGEEYLLYLTQNKDTGSYRTSVCGGNVLGSDAKDNLDWLKKNTILKKEFN